MGITVQHGPDAGLVGQLAFESGQAITGRENRLRDEEIAARQAERQAEYDFRSGYLQQRQQAQHGEVAQQQQLSHRQRQRAMEMAKEVNSIYSHSDELTPAEREQAMRIIAGRYSDLPQNMQESIFANDRIPGVEEPKNPIDALQWYDDPASGQRIPFVMGKDGVPMVPRGFPIQKGGSSGEQGPDQAKIQQQKQEMKVKRVEALTDLRKKRLDYEMKLASQMVEDPDTGVKRPAYSSEERKKMAAEMFDPLEEELNAAYADPDAGGGSPYDGEVTLPPKPGSQQMDADNGQTSAQSYDKMVGFYSKLDDSKRSRMRGFFRSRVEAGDPDAIQAYEKIRAKERPKLEVKVSRIISKMEAAKKGRRSAEMGRLMRELADLKAMHPDEFAGE